MADITTDSDTNRAWQALQQGLEQIQPADLPTPSFPNLEAIIADMGRNKETAEVEAATRSISEGTHQPCFFVKNIIPNPTSSSVFPN